MRQMRSASRNHVTACPSGWKTLTGKGSNGKPLSRKESMMLR